MLLNVSEPNFIQVVELLHVPLQTMFNQPQRKYKIAANGEANDAIDRVWMKKIGTNFMKKKRRKTSYGCDLDKMPKFQFSN